MTTTEHQPQLPTTTDASATTSLLDLGLTDADAGRIAEVKQSLSDISPTHLHTWGGQLAQQSNRFSTQMLDKVRNTDLETSGEKLGEVVRIARNMNLDSFQGKSKVPILGPLLDKMKSARGELVQKYSSTNSQIEQLMKDVGQTQAMQAQRVKEYDQMHAVVRDEHRELGVHVAAGRQRIDELKQSLTALQGQEDPGSRMRRSELDTALRILDKRVSDLHVLQHATEQTLPMIRLIQANGIQLIEKFNTVRDVTLPTWRNQFAIQLSLADQKNAVQLANAIDDASNEILRKNAELMHQTSVETAKANQRAVLDIETLKHVNDKLIQTVEEVRAIYREGITQREQITRDIDHMRQDLQQRLSQATVE